MTILLFSARGVRGTLANVSVKVFWHDRVTGVPAGDCTTQSLSKRAALHLRVAASAMCLPRVRHASRCLRGRGEGLACQLEHGVSLREPIRAHSDDGMLGAAVRARGVPRDVGMEPR